MSKIIYSEPKEYISKELRRKFKLGEFAEEKGTFKAHYYINDNCYIQDGSSSSHLLVIFLDTMDTSKKMNHKLSLVDEQSKEYDVIITKDEYDKLSKKRDIDFLNLAISIINNKESKYNKPNIKLFYNN